MRTFLILVLGLMFTACSTSRRVTPMPDTNPVKVSNERTRKSIKETRVHIKKSQESSKAASDSLEEVERALDELLKK